VLQQHEPDNSQRRDHVQGDNQYQQCIHVPS
jgi:hypothetical protein